MLLKKMLAVALAGGLAFAAGAASAQTVGPSGESATPSADVTLSDADIACAEGQGLQGRALVAHFVRFHECSLRRCEG